MLFFNTYSKSCILRIDRWLTLPMIGDTDFYTISSSGALSTVGEISITPTNSSVYVEYVLMDFANTLTISTRNS